MRYDNKFYNCNNFSSKYQDAIEQRYGNYKHKKRVQFRKDFNDKFGVWENGVLLSDIKDAEKKWWLGTQLPSLANLMNICEVLDCDIDYFLTDQEELRKEIASAAEVTGLSYGSVETLYNFADAMESYDQLSLQCIDFLLSKDGKHLVPLLYSLLFSIEPYEFSLLEEVHFLQNPDIWSDDDEIAETEEYEKIRDSLGGKIGARFLKFGDKLYLPTDLSVTTSSIGSLAYELNQEITKIREREKNKRAKYEGQIEMIVEPATTEFLQRATMKSIEGVRVRKLIEEKAEVYDDYIKNIEMKIKIVGDGMDDLLTQLLPKT